MVSQVSEAAQAAQDQMVARARAIEARAAGSPDLRVVDDEYEYEYEGDPAELSEVQRAVAARYGQVPGEARASADFDADADEIDLEIDGRPRVVNLHRQGGETIRLEIPPMTVDKLDRVEWYMGRYDNRTKEMHKQTDRQKADIFGQQRRRIQEEMVAYVVPDWPVGLMPTLTVKSWNRLWAVIQSMSREATAGGEAEAGSDPNS